MFLDLFPRLPPGGQSAGIRLSGGFLRLAMDGPHLPLKPIKVVADGHGECEQFFERLLGLLKSDGDAAWLKGHTRGEILELLRQDLNRGLDQKLGPFEAILLQLSQDFGDVAAALPLVVAVVALGEAAQMGDEGIPIGEAVGTDTLGNAGSEDLLGAAAADAEEEFYCRAIDERARQALELAEDVVDFAVPDGFCGHGCFTMLVRTSAKCNIARMIDKDDYPSSIAFPAKNG